ncbi:Rec8 like protein-domain-containing protein [Xylaria bambusicola]|uniref:Rec8 like protein-domain-containing protein n=1 Tax=Xylaria bambusicola TaxID=326684 RepID=UPI00200815AB|nr:Rec8 like protein-domain-containing protein [Xylaria bambusicola]KAI0521094.1 Rec8 like protein-domain-containing protein [Xylaria bambusicola]
MFYSHEILTSRQYGVATIWQVAQSLPAFTLALVATTSNTSGTRKVTRKAIQEVDVQRACEKILEPGAPIALRLQGNLLYGVSRVHSQQCAYLAADAKKVQDQMRFFFKAFPNNQLDPEAGRARPEDNLVEDDRAFDPNMPLPQFNPETVLISHFSTQKTSSQMSPKSSQLSGSQSPGQGFMIQLDIDHSSSLDYHRSPLGLGSLSSMQKPDDEPLLLPQNDNDMFSTHGDWGIEVDEHGNIVESAGPVMVDEEPQLPHLPPIQGQSDVLNVAAKLDEVHLFDDGDVIMQEEPLPEAEPFPERQEHIPWRNDNKSARQVSARKQRRLRIDDETQISRRTLRNWQSHYVENCGPKLTHSIPAAQAKRNAMILTFGLGIGNIGQHIGVPGYIHPLAVEFSGDKLFTTITGLEIMKPRGRRRTASQAVEEKEQEEERRVRRRLIEDGEEQEQARAAQEDELYNFDDPFADEALPEVGREEERAMSDHLSSTLLPWNRGSSAIPGSSVRAPASAHKGRDLSSPLGRRDNPEDIARYSDDVLMGGFGSDGNFGGDFGSAYSFEGIPDFDFEGPPKLNGQFTATEVQAENDDLLAHLDREGYNFFNFVQNTIDQNGERRQDEDFDINRKWLAFDDMFIPRDTPRFVAAQAFYHTLCLVTKGRMYVEQYDADHIPFGAIWIGMKTVAAAGFLRNF